ncbi:hypothetical protein BOX37_12260 [Nocardia mangyaensis]|uniref:Uncharacterized protein n=1 Tax=Nocardia mangyaensis TaxID=2213200 RepID=A0A1J0VRD2_9NOCA|nr:hypothetical protein [Nocardia mangyaensis]APE34603.1 hypothetical protein BOX37_12260 [Nocardia mangyaensis]
MRNTHKTALWIVFTGLILAIIGGALYTYLQQSPHRIAIRHSEETTLIGYARVHFDSVCGNTGCSYETYYLVETGDDWVQKISGPGLSMGGRYTLGGPEPYNWGASGRYDDDCHMIARPLDPAVDPYDPANWDVDETSSKELRSGTLTAVKMVFGCGEDDS